MRQLKEPEGVSCGLRGGYLATEASRPPSTCCWHPPSARAQHSCVVSITLGLQVYISYLEIYNEVGYDLLDPTREVQAMEDLPQASAQHNMPWPATPMASASCSRVQAWNSSNSSTWLAGSATTTTLLRSLPPFAPRPPLSHCAKHSRICATTLFQSASENSFTVHVCAEGNHHGG